jgi:methyl-accepting chemotaxis protein
MYKLFTKILAVFKNKKSQEHGENQDKSSSMGIKSIASDLFTSKSILSKMVLVFLLLIIIPVSTIGFITTTTASKSMIKSAEDSITSTTQQTSDYFDIYLEKAQDMSMQIIANSIIQDYLNMKTDGISVLDVVNAQNKAIEALNSINNTSVDITAKIMSSEGKALGELSSPPDIEAVKETDWYKKVKEASGKWIWIDYSEGMTGNKGESVVFNQYKAGLSLVRMIKSLKIHGDIGVVFVDVSYAKISSFLSNIDLGMDDSTYLLTNEGKVLSSDGYDAEEALSQKQFIKEVKQRSQQEEAGLFPVDESGQELLVAFTKSPNTGMTVITTVPYSVISASSRQITRTTIIFGALFVLLATAFGFSFSLRMTVAMKSIMRVMSKAEQGDLSVSLFINRKDEIGKLASSFNSMLKKIKELVLQNKKAAEEVVVSSDKMAGISSESSRISSDIAHAVAEVAIGSSNQASEIETSVRNVSQLADRISLAVEKTLLMEEASETMQSLSDFGITTIEALNEKTAITNDITINVVKEINQLNQYVKNINVITNVLRGIADQTNLLALNAAIEAARAGEAGRGFAVVADEIRKLAEQSNSRTRDIQKHVENIFKQAQSSTKLVGAAETSFKEQSEMVSNTAEVFSRINTTIASLVGNINQLGDVINDMDSFKEKVLSSMENISAVSEEVSASTEEVSASTEEQLTSIEQLDDMAKQLNELAGNLLTLMGRFKF